MQRMSNISAEENIGTIKSFYLGLSRSTVLMVAIMCTVGMIDLVTGASCVVPYGSPNIAVIGRSQNHTGGVAVLYDQASTQISVAVFRTTSVAAFLSDHINFYHVIVDGSLARVFQANSTAKVLYPLVSGLDARYLSSRTTTPKR
jgi:hypothetical protein